MDSADDLRTATGLVVPGESLRWSFTRARGAGGQHVNKTATKVTVEVDVAAVCGAAAALDRLHQAHPERPRVSSRTSRSQ